MRYSLGCFAVLLFLLPSSFGQTPALRSDRIQATPHFEIRHDFDPDVSADLGHALEEARAEFLAAFRNAGFVLAEPDRRLEWRCFATPAEYRAYAASVGEPQAGSLEAYYSTRTNCVALLTARPAEGRLQAHAAGGAESSILATTPATPELLALAPVRHEAAHQLAFNCGLQKRGIAYPLWLSEGLACAFEAPSTQTAAGAPNAARLRALRKAHAGERLWPLAQLVALVECPAGDDTALAAYAQSWAFFQYLFTRRPAQLQEYMKSLRQVRLGRRSPSEFQREFIACFGSLADTQASFDDYVDSLLAEVTN